MSGANTQGDYPTLANAYLQVKEALEANMETLVLG